MQKVLTAAEMRAVDRDTTERFGIPSLLLMENAAQGAARAIIDKLGGEIDGRSILVLCGPGNNGGDGAALARILWSAGANVEVCLFGLVSGTKGDARTNFEILARLAGDEQFRPDQPDLALEEITSLEEWLEYDSLNFTAEDPDVVIDALFGTGVSRPLDGVYEQAAAFILAYNTEPCDHDTLVVSLDIPSGLDADRAEPIGVNPVAHLTVTFTAPKPANVLAPAARASGELVVVNIGSPASLVEQQPSQLFVTEAADAARWLDATSFTDASYKNKRGHAMVIAGSRNYTGAAVLAGNACIRSGVGLVTLAVPAGSSDSVVARVAPEVMVRSIADTPSGSAAASAADEVAEFLKNIDAVAIGSGLSAKEGETQEFVRSIVEGRRTPVVVDADGLTALSPFSLSGSPELPIILTPHDAEFARLIGAGKDEVGDRVEALRAFCTERSVITVLKGERVLIGDPEGNVIVNPTGNSGLGKAGNGDTLTGLITGFVAQAVQLGTGILEAVVAAAYSGALAGDLAEQKYGKRVMTASDVRDCLAEVFACLEQGK